MIQLISVKTHPSNTVDEKSVTTSIYFDFAKQTNAQNTEVKRSQWGLGLFLLEPADEDDLLAGA
jgi:hypothetical protein